MKMKMMLITDTSKEILWWQSAIIIGDGINIAAALSYQRYAIVHEFCPTIDRWETHYLLILPPVLIKLHREVRRAARYLCCWEL